MFCLALAAVLAGCQTRTQGQSGPLSIKGSNTFGAELGPALIAEYKRQRPDVTVTLESKGYGSGFTALIAGECDIAAVSGGPNEEESRRIQAAGLAMLDNAIGYFGVAVVENGHNGVTNLNRSQVRDIFTGVIKNWREVGGKDAAIHVLAGDSAISSDLGFREMAMEGKPYSGGVHRYSDYPQLAAAVASDEEAIGYLSVGVARTEATRTVLIDGVAPTGLSINEGRYPYCRLLRLYTDRAKESAAAHDFILFVQSDDGQAILAKMGFVPRLEKRISNSFF